MAQATCKQAFYWICCNTRIEVRAVVFSSSDARASLICLGPAQVQARPRAGAISHHAGLTRLLPAGGRDDHRAL